MTLPRPRTAATPRLKLLVDLALLSGAQVLSKVCGFGAFAYLARQLAPADYGSLEYALGISSFFAMVVDLGLGPIGVRELAHGRDRETLGRLTSSIPVARLLTAAVCAPAMVGIIALTADGRAHWSLALPLALTLFPFAFRLDWLLQSLEMMTAAAVAQVLRMAGFALGVLLFVSSATPLWQVGVIELAAALLMTLFYLALQKLRIGPLALRFSWSELSRLARQGMGVGLGQILSAANVYLPMVLVGMLVGGDQSAWFGASHRVVASLATFSLLYHFNLYPLVTRHLHGADAELKKLIHASSRVAAWVSIFAALLLTLLAGPLMSLAFGRAFAASASTFRLLVWYLPLTLLSGHARWLLIAAQRQNAVMVAQLTGTAVTVLVGLPLVLYAGAEGAALTMTLCAAAVWAVAHFSAAKHFRQLAGGGSALLPAALALAGIAWPLRADVSPWWFAALVAATYLCCTLLLDRRLIPDLKQLARAKSDLKGGVA